MNLTVTNSAEVIFNSQQTFSSLTLSGSAKAVASTGGGGTSANSLYIGTGGLSMPADPTTGLPTATLDLMDNDMVLQGAGSAGVAQVQALITSGYSSNTWTGTGITSSDAAAASTSSLKTALGYGLNHLLSVNFNSLDGMVHADGTNLDGTDVIVRYCLVGDLNMDQRVSNLDFTNLSNHINTGQPTTWASGDMDYSGTTTNTDYTLLSNNFGQNLLGPAFARTLLPVGLPITTVEGQGVNNAQVATFTDALNTSSNPTNATDYTATVSWGDANFLPATVTTDTNPNDPAGSYVVTASSPGPLSNPDALIVTMVQYAAGTGLQGRPASLGEPIVSVTPAVDGLVAVPVSASQIDLYWTLNATNATGIEVDRADDGGAFVMLSNSVPGAATTYADATVSEGHSYSYEIRAIQPTTGPSAYTAAADVTTDAVQGLVATAASTTEIDLLWLNLSTDPNATVDVQREGPGDSTFATIASGLPGNTSTFSDTGLAEGTHYVYQVLIHEPSRNNTDTLTAPADTWTLAAAPTNLAITSIASGEVDLTWANGSASSPGFLIERSTDGINFDPVDQVDPGTTTYADTSVADGTSYQYQMVATNDGGDSLASNVASTPTPTPLAVPLLSASAVSASEVDLIWQNTSRTATGFTILRSLSATSGFDPVKSIVGATITTWADTGLTAGTHYYYEIEAATATLTSAASLEADDTTVPPTPASVSVSPASATELDVSWSAAPGATGYLVQRQDSAGWSDIADLSSSVTSYSDTGLIDGTMDHYKVTAYDNAGLSSASAAATNTTTLTVPSAPANTQATALAKGVVQVTWQNESHDEAGYRVERWGYNDPTPAWGVVGTTLPGVTTLVDSSNLVAGRTYHYRVFATNAAGDSNPDGSGNVTALAAPVAEAPTGVTASLTGNTLSLSWTAGAGTAGSYQIGIFSVNYSGGDITGGSGSPDLIDVSGTSATVTLPNSYLSVSPTDYYVSVRAVNAAGDAYSPWSGTIKERIGPDPSVTPPNGSPTNIQASGSGGSVNITFDLPPNVGDIVGVELWASGPGLPVPEMSAFTLATAYGQGMGLPLPLPNSAYSITVKLYNAGGYGGSGTVSYTTGDFTPPAAGPTNLQLTSISATEVDVSWSGPAWPNVSLQVSTDPFGIKTDSGATITGSGNTATITGLQPGTPLWLQLGASGSSRTELPDPVAVTTLASAISPPTALQPDGSEIGPDGLPQAADLLFTRGGDLNQDVSVPINLTGTAPGSAYKLVDGYTGQIITGSVNFPAGFSNKVIEVIPINDGTPQWARTVTATEGSAANMQTDSTPATVAIGGGNFGITLGNGSDNQIFQASSDGTQNLLPLAFTLPTTIVPGATITLTINSPVPIDVWATDDPQPGDTPLNATDNTLIWTESSDPTVVLPTIIFVGVKDGSTQINPISFQLTPTDAPPPGGGHDYPPPPPPPPPPPDRGGAARLEIHLIRDPAVNGVVNRDITEKTNSWLIGQLASLAGVVVGPGYLTIANPAAWTIPGIVLKSIDETPTMRKAMLLTPADRNAPFIHFFWVTTAGTGSTSPDTDVITLRSGTLTATTTFRLYSPTSSVLVTQGSPAIAYSSVDADWRLGLLSNSSTVAGIDWSGSVITPAGQGFGKGLFRFVQKVYPWRYEKTREGLENKTPVREWRLDTVDPYPYPPGDSFDGIEGWITDGIAHSTNDSPSNSLDADQVLTSTANDEFRTYLMYKPPGIGSSWVPLQSESWAYNISVKQIKYGVWVTVGTTWQHISPFVREAQEPEWSNVWNSGNLLDSELGA